MRLKLFLSLGLGVLSLSAAVRADVIPVGNYSFESATVTTTTGTATVWTKIGSPSVYNPYKFSGGGKYYSSAVSTNDPGNGPTASTAPLANTQGDQLGFVFNGAAGSGFEQQISGSTYTSGSAYTLSVALGMRNVGTPTFEGSTIEVLAGSTFGSATVIASATDSTGSDVPAGTFIVQTTSPVTLTPSQMSALSGQPLYVALVTTNAAASNGSTDWDNVQLTSTPEPATAGLVVLASLPLLLSRKRRGC